MSEYDFVNTSKLKSTLNDPIKKKKKKSKKKLTDDKKVKLREATEEVTNKVATSQSTIDRRTKAEISFAETKSKRTAKDMIKKASKTHKERIMEFNEQLDSLSEHYDIPKVSWTK